LSIALGCARTTHLPPVRGQGSRADAGRRDAAGGLDSAAGMSSSMDVAAELDAAPSAPDSASAPRAKDAVIEGRDAGAPQDAAPFDAADSRAAIWGKLELSVLTKPSPNSDFQPLNLLAVWVENDAGRPIKVLARWAGARAAALRVFNMRVPGAFAITPASQDAAVAIGRVDPDVITGATLRTHELHTLEWNLSDYRAMRAPLGDYSICIESTDNLMASYVAEIQLTLAAEPFVFDRAENAQFGPIHVVYTPPH
jgi:hypothetical protein